jgi:hypothetical protein
MVKEFHIKTPKRKYKFLTVSAMDEFISKYKKILLKATIFLIDENNKAIGTIKISNYVKADK